jgi:hypothetical protein
MASERKPGRTQNAGDAKAGLKKPVRRENQSGGLRGKFSLDSEQSARLLIVGAVALVIVIGAGFLVFGYWYSVVRPRNRTVLQVADQTVSYSAMKRRMAYEFLRNTTYQSQQGFQQLPEAAYQSLLNELTEITQAGPKLGLSVDQSEAGEKLRARLSLPSNADQRQFADALRGALEKSGLTESEYRSIVNAETFNTKILDKFTADVPATVPQAKLAVISMQTEAAAKQAIGRIEAGEDFSDVAKTASTELDVATTGGVKDYAPKESLNIVFRDFAFSAAIGSVSGPLTSTAPITSPADVVLYYVVKVLDRAEQPPNDTQKGEIASERLPDWLKSTQDELKANGALKRDWDQKSQTDALIAISSGVGAKLAAQKQQQQQDDQRKQDVRQTVIAQLTSSPRAAGTPAAETTPVPGATPSDQGLSASPAAPSQPVPPGSNGQ